MIFCPRFRELTNTAMSSPKPISSTTARTVKITVFHTACWKYPFWMREA